MQKKKVLSLLAGTVLAASVVISGVTVADKIGNDNNKPQSTNTTTTAGVVNDVIPVLADVTIIEDQVEEVSEPVVLETGYTTEATNVRSEPNTESDILGVMYINETVEYESVFVEDEEWCKFAYGETDGYIRADLVHDEPAMITVQKTEKQSKNYNTVKTEQTNTTETPVTQQVTYSSSNVLTRSAGRIQGPSGQETYYNLPMDGVLRIMRNMGNNDEYWVRSDGVKMLGQYVMVAADLNIRPRGSLVMTSLGMGIVCDTGTFAYSNPTQIDICVTW